MMNTWTWFWSQSWAWPVFAASIATAILFFIFSNRDRY